MYCPRVTTYCECFPFLKRKIETILNSDAILRILNRMVKKLYLDWQRIASVKLTIQLHYQIMLLLGSPLNSNNNLYGDALY